MDFARSHNGDIGRGEFWADIWESPGWPCRPSITQHRGGQGESQHGPGSLGHTQLPLASSGEVPPQNGSAFHLEGPGRPPARSTPCPGTSQGTCPMCERVWLFCLWHALPASWGRELWSRSRLDLSPSPLGLCACLVHSRCPACAQGREDADCAGRHLFSSC